MSPVHRGLGKGKGAMQRHRRLLRDNILGITDPAIRRVAYRAGVKRISGSLYDRARTEVYQDLDVVLRRAILFARHADRKTVTVRDVLQALRIADRKLFGIK